MEPVKGWKYPLVQENLVCGYQAVSIRWTQQGWPPLHTLPR